jgi:hypothetical protein
MDTILFAVRSRMARAEYVPGASYAEVMWMTQDEAEEFLQLRLALPSPGQLRRDAAERIKAKHAVT